MVIDYKISQNQYFHRKLSDILDELELQNMHGPIPDISRGVQTEWMVNGRSVKRFHRIWPWGYRESRDRKKDSYFEELFW